MAETTNVSNAFALIPQLGEANELTEIQQLILEEMKEDDNAFDFRLMRYKIASGGVGNFWLGSDDNMDTGFTAHVAAAHKIRGFWCSRGQNTPPVCSSQDGINGMVSGELTPEDIQAMLKAKSPHPATREGFDITKPIPCMRCPMNRWGSDYLRQDGTIGRGKACKEMRRLLLLVPGIKLPVIMSLPPTSISPWDEYCSSLYSHGSYYFATKTRFELESDTAPTGESYNFVRLTQAEELTVEEFKQVREFRHAYKEAMEGMAIDSDDYEGGEVVEQDGQYNPPAQQDNRTIDVDDYESSGPPPMGTPIDTTDDEDIPF